MFIDLNHTEASFSNNLLCLRVTQVARYRDKVMFVLMMMMMTQLMITLPVVVHECVGGYTYTNSEVLVDRSTHKINVMSQHKDYLL